MTQKSAVLSEAILAAASHARVQIIGRRKVNLLKKRCHIGLFSYLCKKL